MEYEIVKITQEDIDNQNKNEDALYLSGVKAGDYVASFEIFMGRKCVDFLHHVQVEEVEKSEFLEILNQLDTLNK